MKRRRSRPNWAYNVIRDHVDEALRNMNEAFYQAVLGDSFGSWVERAAKAKIRPGPRRKKANQRAARRWARAYLTLHNGEAQTPAKAATPWGSTFHRHSAGPEPPRGSASDRGVEQG